MPLPKALQQVEDNARERVVAALEELNETARRYAAGETASVSERQNVKAQIVRSNRLIADLKSQ